MHGSAQGLESLSRIPESSYSSSNNTGGSPVDQAVPCRHPDYPCIRKRTELSRWIVQRPGSASFSPVGRVYPLRLVISFQIRQESIDRLADIVYAW